MTSEPVVEATAPPKHQFGPVVAVVVLVGLAGMLFLFSLRSWAVNFDGTSYLALAANIRELNGYVAPDGSAMTIRGPGYPMLLALGWLFEGFPSGLAMAASRIGIVVGGVGAALITLRIGRSGAAAVVGGLLALASPILLPSGAVGFAPDGLAATVAVVAVLLLVARPASPWAVVSAGLLTGLAYVTKEGHALVMVGALLWGIIAAAETRRASRFVLQFGIGAAAIILPWFVYGMLAIDGLPGILSGFDGALGWAVVVAVPVVLAAVGVRARKGPTNAYSIPTWLAALGSFAVVVVVTTRGGTDTDRWMALPGRIADTVVDGAYRDGWVVAALIVLILGCIGMWRWRRDLGPVPAVVAGGMGLLVFSAYAGTGVRNAAILPLLLGAMAALTIVPEERGRRAPIVVAWIVSLVAIGAGVGASFAFTDDLDAERLTAEARPTVLAAQWIVDEAPEATVVGTPTAYQSVWRLGSQNPATSLVPIYLDATDRVLAGMPLDRAYGWLGKPEAPVRAGEAVAYAVIGPETSAVFAEDLEEVLRTSDYVVLTGNTRYPASPADAGLIALVLEANEAVVPVFVDHFEDSQWVAIVRPASDISVTTDPLVRYTEVPGDPRFARGGLDLVSYSHEVDRLLTAWADRIP